MDSKDGNIGNEAITNIFRSSPNKGAWGDQSTSDDIVGAYFQAPFKLPLVPV